MGLIFYFSNIPAGYVNHLSNSGIDQITKSLNQFAETPVPILEYKWLKVGHVVGYFLLGLSFYLALTQYPNLKKPRLSALALSFVYALTDEFHQSFIPGRTCELIDLIVDLLAAGTALLLITGVAYIKKR